MITLEQLRDGSVADRNFQKLMQLVPDTGGVTAGIRFGTLTLSWTSGNTLSGVTSNTAHGLGRTPVLVLVMPVAAQLPTIGFGQAFGLDATTFDAQGYTASAPGSNVDVTCGWVAIG